MFLVSISKVTVLKNLYSLYITPSGHWDGSTIKFFYHLNTQSSLYRWLYWNMWTIEVSFFKVFGGDFIWNCCRVQEAEKFQTNPGQFKCITRETRYYLRLHRGTLCTKSQEPSCRISMKTLDHPENILFQWGPPIFPHITGDKVSLSPG